MTTLRDSCSLIEKCAFLLLVITAAFSVTADQECNPEKCPGPLRYYKNLGCKPVYQNEGDCCAIRYDCDHLKSRSKDKCYVNGHEYSIGEELKEEHKNPCDLGCMCRAGQDGIASFVCAIVDCFPDPSDPSPNCYYKHTPNQCCAGPRVCLDNIEDRPKCVTDTGLYYDGEYFRTNSDPDLNCYCQPGYKGENVEPFCKKPNHPYCTPDFHKAYEIHKNCAPVFYASQPPQTSCSLSSRCQNSNDTVIHNHEEGKAKSGEEDETMMCKFGDLRMHIGDELNQGTGYSSVCVKCLCQVPPLPTCQHLPDSECNKSDHQPFST